VFKAELPQLDMLSLRATTSIFSWLCSR